jgi:poly-gamma-glutamate capsule biosynthesis protein CapA/YwtB (metallophosphatase superfamily)
MTTDLPFRLSAVGDISFEGSEADRTSIDCFGDVTSVFQDADLVVGNLECALVQTGEATSGKCVLRGSPEWASTLKSAGIGVVSLANNHIMDYGKQGLLSTIETLRRAGVRHVGAGTNRHEARSPLFLDAAGRRIALLGRTAVIVSSPSYAGENDPGVAFLDPDETATAIRSSGSQADLVILLVHWGMEEYSYPSPTQRQLARQLADAGADVILGHHPHVLQGIEFYGPAVIAYSLGNFIFNEFEWRYMLPNGAVSRQGSPLSPDNRKGIIATLDWTRARTPMVSAKYTRIDLHGRVRVDADQTRELEMNLLSTGIRRRWYRIWWQWYAIRREWHLRLHSEMSFWRLLTNLHRLRLRHLTSLFGSLRRSARMVSEKSTNPYE